MVYTSRARASAAGTKDECFDSVTNVGNRPTFGADSFAIETHLLNFHPIELSAETEVELHFLDRLRDEIKFPSIEALKEQIGRDVERRRGICGGWGIHFLASANYLIILLIHDPT